MTDSQTEKYSSVESSEHLHAPAPVMRREVESKQLFAGGKELLIRHDGECYTLRHTSKGKLILTK
jgi:hemin uptake protein HemP